MKLSQVLYGINYEIINGKIDIEINNIEYDSRKIKNGDLFVCIKGFNTDGHKYANIAYNNGAAVIVCEETSLIPSDVACIKVDNSRKALAIMAANYYNHPEKKLKLIGVTGTNGKTTSTFMIRSVLNDAGFQTGIIGTIANYIGDIKLDTSRTTPESLELFSLFSEMVKDNIDYCIMEVSSHSLALYRVYGIIFDIGIFTNLTRDHLDFHKTFENYYKAKGKLFENSKTSIINIDDEYGKKYYNDINKDKITYGIDKNSEIHASDIEIKASGTSFTINIFNESEKINLKMTGKYNVYNALCAAAACSKCGLSMKDIKCGLENITKVQGRCENVPLKDNIKFNIIIDYAHTPDGLENILKTAREFTKEKLICVFGCGGDRDKTKRPIMGKIAASLSDYAIVTSDNPRSEEPMDIIKEIAAGIDKNNYLVVENRKSAIKRAIMNAKTGDVIVLAGKGHETYQILKDETIHFDEREVISDIIKELF